MAPLPRITRIWGPLKTERYTNCIIWSFRGVRENGTFCRWTLAFYFDTRRFSARRVHGGREAEAQAKADLMPNLTAGPVQEGRVTPMLRAMLKPEHIAEATRLAMERSR